MTCWRLCLHLSFQNLRFMHTFRSGLPPTGAEGRRAPKEMDKNEVLPSKVNNFCNHPSIRTTSDFFVEN